MPIQIPWAIPQHAVTGFVVNSYKNTYPRVKPRYQVHLWNTANRNFGILFDSDKNREDVIGHDIARELRLMNGHKHLEEIISLTVSRSSMNREDAEIAINSITKQFESEGVVEISTAPLPERFFSNPLTLPYQLKILQLQLTNRCNLSCKHCYANSGALKEHEIAIKDTYRLIDEFVNLGGCRLFLTGGESLLYDELDSVISYARNRHLSIYLSTNGLAMTETRAEQLIKLGVKSVNISIDGENAKTHDDFRGKAGAFEKAISALKFFSERNIACGTQTTLFKHNLSQSATIYNKMRELGAQSCFFVRMMPAGRGMRHTELIPSFEEYKLAREEEYFNRKSRYGVDIYPGKSTSKKPKTRCSAGISQLYVRADGSCYPCPSLEIDELNFGTFPENSLYDLWNSSNDGIKKLRSFDLATIDNCKNCEHFHFCKGGCAGNAFHATGDWQNSDPHFCITMEIRKRLQFQSPSTSLQKGTSKKCHERAKCKADGAEKPECTRST